MRTFRRPSWPRQRPMSLWGQATTYVASLAGQYACCYVARIGHHTGNRRHASGFGTLAARYAEASGDPLFTGTRRAAARDSADTAASAGPRRLVARHAVATARAPTTCSR